jgi:hypothetical protein
VTKRRPGKTSWSPMPSKVKLGNRVVRHIFYSMVVCGILKEGEKSWDIPDNAASHWNKSLESLFSKSPLG